MPLQNRVTPLGELVAEPGRGLVYGNRGCLHDAAGRIRRPYNGKRWISCRLDFRGWLRRPLLQPGRFTELFFLDEATALSAGHRPCAECRREDFVHFRRAWAATHPGASLRVDDIDRTLHSERLDPGGGKRRHPARLGDLPDGSMVLEEDRAWIVLGADLMPWSPFGYGKLRAMPASATVLTLTPPSMVEVIRAGYEPGIHPTALGSHGPIGSRISRRHGRSHLTA